MKRILKVSVIGAVLILFFTTDNFSQESSDTSQLKQINTDQEEFIFEDDTVVLPSDTIRITDTITIIDDSIKKIKASKKNKPAISFISIPSRYIKHSIDFQFSIFLTNQFFNNAELIDSVIYPNSQPLNYYYDLKYGIQLYKWLFKAGINYISFSEKSQKGNVFIKDTIDENSIKTLRKTLDIRNYYYYAGLSLDISYVISIEKFSLNPELNFILSKNIISKNYKFGSGEKILTIENSELSPYLILMGVSLPLGYDIYKNMSVFIKPSLYGNLNYSNKFPHILQYSYNLGIGLKYIF